MRRCSPRVVSYSTPSRTPCNRLIRRSTQRNAPCAANMRVAGPAEEVEDLQGAPG